MLGERIINTAYCFGAAVVVFGAWAKVENKEFSDTALTIGLLVESTIFLIYGCMEWRKGSAQLPGENTPMPKERADDNQRAELADALKTTNRILNKVFRAD
jgi:hypothetical protein